MANEKKTVLVMGEAGSGKSSFINLVHGKDPGKPAIVGAGSFSCTKIVVEFLYTRKDGVEITLVDTPGFNHYGDSESKLDDGEILELITSFLKPTTGEQRAVAGVVFLHSITSHNPSLGNAKKMLRALKKLCGKSTLENVVVATTRWDEIDEADAEGTEEGLLTKDGFFKDLNDQGVHFLRTGHFSDNAPLPAGGKYLSPLAIVERVLRLEAVVTEQPDTQAADGEATKDAHSAALVLNEHKFLSQDSSRNMEDIKKTLEDLRSATDTAKSERMEMNEDLKKRLNIWESMLSNFIARCEGWESTQNLQQEEVKSRHSEVLKAQEKLQYEFRAELKRVLEANQKERAELSSERQTLRDRERKLNDDLKEARQKVSDLQSDQVKLLQDLDSVKSERAAIDFAKMETDRLYVVGLRTELEKAKGECEQAKASQLETTRELEGAKGELGTQTQELVRLREQVQTQTSEREVLTRQITALETEREDGKKRSEELTQEAIHLKDQLQAETIWRKRHTARITSLETELEKFKEMEQEAIRLKDEARAKASESELLRQQIASLAKEVEERRKESTEQKKDSASLNLKLQDGAHRIAALESQLEEMKRKSEVHIQESTRLQDELRARAIESERHEKRSASLETEIEKSREELKQATQESARLEKQAQAKTIENEQSKRKITLLEKGAEESKKKSKDHAQELARLKKQVQEKINSGKSATNRIASLEVELKEWKKTSEEQAQETTRLREQVQEKVAESEGDQQRITSLEAELEDSRQRLRDETGRLNEETDRLNGETNRLNNQVRSLLIEAESLKKKNASLEQELESLRTASPRPLQQPKPTPPHRQQTFPGPNPHRTGTPLNQRQATSPPSMGYPPFNPSQSPPIPPPSHSGYSAYNSAQYNHSSTGPQFPNAYPASPPDQFHQPEQYYQSAPPNQPPVDPGFNPLLQNLFPTAEPWNNNPDPGFYGTTPYMGYQ